MDPAGFFLTFCRVRLIVANDNPKPGRRRGANCASQSLCPVSAAGDSSTSQRQPPALRLHGGRSHALRAAAHPRGCGLTQAGKPGESGVYFLSGVLCHPRKREKTPLSRFDGVWRRCDPRKTCSRPENNFRSL